MKKKTYVIVFAIFLGNFGVHRFYLGQHKKGLRYLLFCWTLVPAIIAMVDAIVFALMREADFYCKYNLPHIDKLGIRREKKTMDELHMKMIEEENTPEEQKAVSEIEQLATKEKVRAYLHEAKLSGKYLPRMAYARAKAILEDKPWDVHIGSF
jgi:TM2 domain-containing membrane protein YozV